MLEFLKRLGKGRYHSLTRDRATQEAATGLAEKGFIEINEFNQACFTGKR